MTVKSKAFDEAELTGGFLLTTVLELAVFEAELFAELESDFTLELFSELTDELDDGNELSADDELDIELTEELTEPPLFCGLEIVSLTGFPQLQHEIIRIKTTLRKIANLFILSPS